MGPGADLRQRGAACSIFTNGQLASACNKGNATIASTDAHDINARKNTIQYLEYAM